MKPHGTQAEPNLDELLESGKIIQHVPEIVRARSLSRARATLAVMTAMPREPNSVVRRRGLTVALAASLALVVGAAVATAALLGRTAGPSQPVPPTPPASPLAERPIPPSTLEVTPSPPLPELQPTFTPKPQRLARPATAQESYAAELDLLARAQVACASREFSSALVLVAEHGRKFPSGRLAEEREALRVRALEGAGRTEEARRAAAAFANRFPRSIMLPRQGGDPR